MSDIGVPIFKKSGWYKDHPMESFIVRFYKDLDDVYSRFTKEGIEFINSPHLSADGLAKVAFCRDPDGFFIELVEEMK